MEENFNKSYKLQISKLILASLVCVNLLGSKANASNDVNTNKEVETKESIEMEMTEETQEVNNYEKLEAKIGWKYEEGSWYYFNKSEEMQKGWIKLGSTWYYLSDSGELQTGWYQDNGYWYYSNSSGAMQTGWINNNGTWYYLNRWGAMSKGWVYDNGYWYYLSEYGAMRTGWINNNGTWYYLNKWGAMNRGWYWDKGKWYYSDNSGAMKTGWIKLSNNWYYLDASGAMRTGWYRVRDTWYYSNDSGVMHTGWKKIGSDWYYLQEPNGHMRTGEVKIGNKTHLFASSGRWLKEINSEFGDKILDTARSLSHHRYVFGASSPNVGFDCSGFVQYVYKKNGIDLPRTTFQQVHHGKYVSVSDLQPGDILYFGSSNSYITHVGIYAGNGNVIHALNPRVGIIEETLFNGYWNEYNFRFAKRIK